MTPEERNAVIEECARVCDAYADKRWKAYKGLEGASDERGCDIVQGESSGAEDCAVYIRALKSQPVTPDKRDEALTPDMKG